MCDIVSFLKFVLLCCPEGTYVKEADRMISFKREREREQVPSSYYAIRRSQCRVGSVGLRHHRDDQSLANVLYVQSV